VTSGVADRTARDGRTRVRRRPLVLLARIAEGGAIACLTVLACVVILQVASRYVLHAPIDWTVDGATALMIWLSFAGAALAAFERAHFVIDGAVDMLPPAGRRAAIVFSNLCASAVLAVLVFYGWRFAMLQMGQDYPALPLAKGWVALAIPVGAALMIPRFVADAVAAALGRPVGDDRLDDGER
jgi:TRAP-type transport system small permease protein